MNIAQTVARLHRAGKLGGFHFNDSNCDDDLASASINPHQLFLVFNELAEAETQPRAGFDPAYMIDQSNNVTDPHIVFRRGHRRVLCPRPAGRS